MIAGTKIRPRISRACVFSLEGYIAPYSSVSGSMVSRTPRRMAMRSSRRAPAERLGREDGAGAASAAGSGSIGQSLIGSRDGSLRAARIGRPANISEVAKKFRQNNFDAWRASIPHVCRAKPSQRLAFAQNVQTGIIGLSIGRTGRTPKRRNRARPANMPRGGWNFRRGGIESDQCCGFRARSSRFSY